MTDYYKEPVQDDEIDLLELIQTLWKERKTIIKWTLIFTFIGLFIAVFSPKEYTATTVMVPQTSGSKVGGNLSGLAAMAGINLNSGSVDGIPPNLYPNIVNSVPFKKTMLDTKIKIDNLDDVITYEEYIEDHQKFNLISSIKKYTIGLPGLLLKSLKGEEKINLSSTQNDSIIRISNEEYKTMKTLIERMSISVNDKEGFVSLSVTMPEALASAQMTDNAQKLLQESVTTFKINKAQEQLDFIENRYEEAKKDFLNKQANLASFQDRNRGISTALFATRLERLKADYNLAYNVYSELAKQLEAQKIQVKEDTPVFTIIEPVSVPVEKSKPKRVMILAVFILFGLIVSIGVILGKEWLKSLNIK